MDRDATRAGVRDTYDRIALHFAETRHSPWPEVEEFVHSLSGERGLDLGCGNGRHLELLESVVNEVIGIDVSQQLLAQVPAAEFPLDLVTGDATTLPLSSDTIDIAIYVATLHHLPTRSQRVRSLNELGRVLHPGGSCLVSVWSVTADRFDFCHGRDQHITWTLPDGETVDRFYHIFDRDEFAEELEAANITVESIRASSGNYYATVSPPPNY